VVALAIQALGNLTHRGAVSADAASGDGAGITIQTPRDLLADEAIALGLPRDALDRLAVAMVSHAPTTPSRTEPSPEPATPAAPVPLAPAAARDVERGRSVYGEQTCSTCHSIGGSGNPRYPLDGVGSRWDRTELKAWITGTGIAADLLAPGIARRKPRYQNIPDKDLEALITYLASLEPAKRPDP
jgi:mono/diheme cytochrome c family protein